MARLNYESTRAASSRPNRGEATIQEFIPWLIMLGVGLAGVLIWSLLNVGVKNAAVMMLILGVATIIQVVIGVAVAFLVAMVINCSFGELRTAWLKLAGIIVLCLALNLWIPLGGLVTFFVYLGLLAWAFQLQIYEALIFAVVFSVVQFVILIAMASV
jgi:hypothetical protein